MLEMTSQEIELLSEPDLPPADEAEQSLTERFSAMIDSSLRIFDVSEQLDGLRRRVSTASEHIIDLIVIFVLETVILPVVFVWAFIAGIKSLGERATNLR